MGSHVLLTALLLLLSCLLLAAEFTVRSPWTWTCDRNATHSRCIKEKIGARTIRPLTLQGCKLTCGQHGALWPKPSSVSLGDSLAYFLPSKVASNFKAGAEDKALLEEAFKLFLKSVDQYHPRYGKESFPLDSPFGMSLNKLYITVELTGSKQRLGLNTTDEQYTLKGDTVDDSTQIAISAPTYFGARHALETLSQLIEYDENEEVLMIVDTADIFDKPAYPYRGILLDTSRNYYSVESLKRVLDAMSQNKLNTFHWHVTDSNSFPIVLKSLPKVAYYGAHSGSQVYTAEDVRELVEYGRIRGIRVLPELDAPAHAAHGWDWGHEENLGNLAVCIDREPWQKYCWQPPCGQLNIANPNMYTVLSKVYEEIADMFGPLDLFHFGGDEVSMQCWNTTDEVIQWMKQQGSDLSLSSYFEKWGEFQQKAYQLFTQANKNREITGIFCSTKLTDDDKIDRYLNKSQYIIQLRTTTNVSDPNIASILRKNFRVIFSNYDAWYLDCGFSAWYGEGSNWCAPYKGWQTIYDNDPVAIAQNLTNNQANVDLIIGGEACLWSEQTDEHVVDSKLWPRGAALAERLWSNPNHKWGPAETRMINHRQRMVKRGIQADRLQPQWCHQNEGLCYRDYSTPLF